MPRRAPPGFRAGTPWSLVSGSSGQGGPDTASRPVNPCLQGQKSDVRGGTTRGTQTPNQKKEQILQEK